MTRQAEEKKRADLVGYAMRTNGSKSKAEIIAENTFEMVRMAHPTRYARYASFLVRL